MLDLKFIIQNPDTVKQAAINKNVEADVDLLIKNEQERKLFQQQIDEIGKKRNEISRATNGGKPTEEQIAAGKSLKNELAKLEEKLKASETISKDIMEKLPNIPTSDTPIGKDESKNVVLKTVGIPRNFDFPVKEHWQIAEEKNSLSSEKAANISGSRFVYMKGDLALLELAIINFVFETLTSKEKLSQIIKQAEIEVSDKPFIPVFPPVMMKPEVMQKMGRLEPKEERYHIESDDLYLIGSAEHTLGPLHMDETLTLSDLPIRYLGFSPAFRREAGSYGKDIRGIIRLHQFNKCEMESFSAPDNALAEHKLFVAIQEFIMSSLEIPYQVVLKCTGDQGIPNARAVDIESWFPGQDKYRETHTSDYMTDFQARRLKTKVKISQKQSLYVHMNDGTASAGRTIAAIIENNQKPDGSVTIPNVLQKFMGGRMSIFS